MPVHSKARTFTHHCISLFWIALGACLAATALKVFLQPHELIDGGIVGVAMILARLYDNSYLGHFLIVLNIPFAYLAFRYIRRSFVIHMLIAVLLFAGCFYLLKDMTPFDGDNLEIIVFGGALLGVGTGLIIRFGGCLDGTEILAILINRKMGFTVGRVVLVCNFFIFGAYGWIFQDWHIALKSLMTFIVAMKMIDMVIVGLDELKSVLIISSKPKEMSEAIMTRMGLGLTIMHGKGGYSGESRDILFVTVERLDLSDLKELILEEDPGAFITIQDLHEVVYGKHPHNPHKKKGKLNLFKKSV